MQVCGATVIYNTLKVLPRRLGAGNGLGNTHTKGKPEEYPRQFTSTVFRRFNIFGPKRAIPNSKCLDSRAACAILNSFLWGF